MTQRPLCDIMIRPHKQDISWYKYYSSEKEQRLPKAIFGDEGDSSMGKVLATQSC